MGPVAQWVVYAFTGVSRKAIDQHTRSPEDRKILSLAHGVSNEKRRDSDQEAKINAALKSIVSERFAECS